jgi:hypothetical protein
MTTRGQTLPVWNNSKNSNGTQDSTTSDRAERMKCLNLSIMDLLNPEKPWILFDKGSILGYFDWVPEKLRMGPWSPFAPAVRFSLVYMATRGIVISYWSIRFETEPSLYPQVDTRNYNLLACLWISWVCIIEWFGPVGPYAWASSPCGLGRFFTFNVLSGS